MLKDAPIHAYIPASNLPRARKFYEEIIGLQPKAEYAGGVVYECGGVSVFLYPTPNAGTSKLVKPSGRSRMWKWRSPN